MRLFCVTRASIAAVNDALRRACEDRGVDFVPVGPGATWLPLSPAPAPGDAVYRAATDLAAERVEAVLLGPGIASFHVAPGFVVADPLAVLVRA